MPLDPTARQLTATPPNRHRTRLLPVAFAACLAVLSVAGCSTGDARDAQLAEDRDATQEAKVPARQASFIADEFFDSTPPPVKTATPRAVLRSIALTTGVNSDGAPSGIYGSVPSDAGRVYVAAQIAYLQPGERVVASWATIAEKPKDIIVIANSETTVEGNEEWVSLPVELYGNVTPGKYAVSLYIDGELLNSLAFEITSAGTSPRQIGNA